MTSKLTISTAQLNFTVGDLEGNKAKIIAAHKKAKGEGADLVVFSEMAITGYPPEDLVLRPDFQLKAVNVIRELAPFTSNGTAMLVGGLWQEPDGKIYNAAALLDEGEIKHITCKNDLPNYGVFDEKRVFAAAPLPEPLEFRGVKLGVMICEDLWNATTSKHLKKKGAEILISLNASPFEVSKSAARLEIARKNVSINNLPLIYVNQIGGQDELVFDGGSFILDKRGKMLVKQSFWEESIFTSKWKKVKTWTAEETEIEQTPDDLSNVYNALKIGLHDYVTKNKFPGVIIGMSGGIDSALTAVIAADALGKEKVRLIMMPSEYTSKESIKDATECADMIGIPLETISIRPMVKAFDKALQESFAGHSADITEENLQSRIRGDILMALSNKFGSMVLTTGNKSEMAVGYATLYGDMCGGYNILKDIYKTQVFELSRWRNRISDVIPENIITKAPTAELRYNQKDEDSLPPYLVLDDILKRLIEQRHSSKQVTESGYPPEVVDKVARLVKLAEYKRRQAPPGVKITALAFGRDRRYPITSDYGF